jgi:hypothetical protein
MNVVAAANALHLRGVADLPAPRKKFIPLA